MKAFTGPLRTALWWFFVSHIPITICLDSQALSTSRYFYGTMIQPPILKDLITFYTTTFGDFLMRDDDENISWVNEKGWFSSLIVIELLFQFPCFFIMIYFLNTYPKQQQQQQQQQNNGKNDDDKNNDGATSTYPEWFRLLCIIYSSHVATTLLPIYATFWLNYQTFDSLFQLLVLSMIYSPYLIFPLILLWYSVKEDFGFM